MNEMEYLKWLIMILLSGFTYMLKRELDQKTDKINALEIKLEKKVEKDDFKEFKEELRMMIGELRTDIKNINHG